jgi:hypothetical protein
MNLIFISMYLPLCSVVAQWEPANSVLSAERNDDGIRMTLQTGILRIIPCAENIVRITTGGAVKVFP